jgi:hypothetical protein
VTLRRVTLVGFALVVASAVAIGVGVATNAEGQDPLPSFRSDLSDFTPQTVRDFAGFPLYSLGMQFEELPLTAIVRIDQESTLKARGGFGIPDNRPNHMNFIYGTCEATGHEGGCPPPLSVQIWPACDRTLQDYYYNVPGGGPSRPYELVTVRSVPAARFSGMLEIYSGTVTIVIFGASAAQQERAAENLVSANILAGNVSADDPLPPPVPGAMKGKLRCGRKTG